MHASDEEWSEAWLSLGGEITEQHAPGCMVAASCGPDPKGSQGREVCRAAIEAGAVTVIVEGPPAHPVAAVVACFSTRGSGWQWQEITFQTAELGEQLARQRWAVVATRAGTPQAEEHLAHLRLPFGPPAAPVMRRKALQLVQVDRLVLDPRVRGAAGPHGPKAVGHYWAEGKKRLLFGMGGPLPWPKFEDGARQQQLVYDPVAPGNQVRIVEAEEFWGLAGREPELVGRRVPEDGNRAQAYEEAIKGARRWPGRRVAVALLLAGGGAPEGKAGACRDSDADMAAKLMADWVAAWRRGRFPRRLGAEEEAAGAALFASERDKNTEAPLFASERDKNTEAPAFVSGRDKNYRDKGVG